MKVGDLVHMPGSIEPATGIILRAPLDRGDGPAPSVQVYWIEDAESSWEPRKWLEVLSESR